jgi:hypothetical protein
MAFLSRNASRLIGKLSIRLGVVCLLTIFSVSLVPLGVSVALFQASLYDVPGGFRAVMFDRFSGVSDKVGCISCLQGQD